MGALEELVNMVYVEGDVIKTACCLFIFGFALEFVLGICNIIKSGYSTVRR